MAVFQQNRERGFVSWYMQGFAAVSQDQIKGLGLERLINRGGKDLGMYAVIEACDRRRVADPRLKPLRPTAIHLCRGWAIRQ